MTRARLRAAAFTALISGSANAQTLNQALREAYKTNPNLAHASLQYAAEQAQIAIARSDGRPRISLNGFYAHAQTETFYNRWMDSYRSEATLSQDLYSGGRVRAAVRSARARAEAEKFNYIAQRQAVQIEVVSAYLDVLVSEEACRLQDLHVEALEEDVRASRAEEREGSGTRTDTEQSLARLAGANAERIQASSDLQVAREQFRALVGRYPSDLTFPKPLPVVPTSMANALDTANSENPTLRSLAKAIEAAVSDEVGARGLRKPSVIFSANVGYGRNNDPSMSPRARWSAAIGLTLTIPLYQGGRPGAEIRQAQDNVEGRNSQWRGMEDQVVAETIADAAAIQTADEHAVSAKAAVDANREALRGVRLGEQFGDRTRLDILNAEQELLESELALSQARALQYTSRIKMLGVIGSTSALDVETSPPSLSDTQEGASNAAARQTRRPSNPVPPRSEQPILKLDFDLSNFETPHPDRPVHDDVAHLGHADPYSDATHQGRSGLIYDLSGFA